MRDESMSEKDVNMKDVIACLKGESIEVTVELSLVTQGLSGPPAE